MLEMVGKRLEMDLRQLEGKDRGGAHLPIMLYTNNHCRRSVVALEKRKNIAATKQKKAVSSWRTANSSKRHASNLSHCSLKVWSWKEQAVFVGAEYAAVAAEWRSNLHASSSRTLTWQQQTVSIAAEIYAVAAVR